MSDVAAQNRSARAFAPATRGRRSAGARAALAIVPAGLCLAHLVYGANHTLAALTLTTLAATTAVVVLLLPANRQAFGHLGGLGLAGGLFAALLVAATLSLTPWVPGGPHPLWAWAGGSAWPALTINRGATLIEIAKLGGLGCLFIVGVAHGVSRQRARDAMLGLMAAGGALALLSLIMFLGGVQPGIGQRLSGGFLSANNAASVFGMLTVIAIGWLLREWRHGKIRGGAAWAERLPPLALTLLFAACLTLTASRGGLAATAAAVLTLMVWELFAGGGGRRRVLGLMIAVGLLAAALLLLGGQALVIDRLERVGVDAVARGEILQAHWTAVQASPWMGYGLGTFVDVNTLIVNSETYPYLWRIRAMHNVYLQWIEEGGLIGAALMFAAIAAVMGRACLGGRAAQPEAAWLRALICASLVLLVHGLSDYALQVPSIAAFWAFLLGLQFAWGQTR